MGDARFEEKSPLLLYMVDGEENNPCKSNHKTVNLEKGRLHGISSGATTVFTQFPNYFSPCWITTMLSAIIFLMMLLLMLPSMVPVPKTNLRIPRCIHENNKEILSNQTIHLVHSSGNWTDEQLDLLGKIRNVYYGYAVRLIVLTPSRSKLETTGTTISRTTAEITTLSSKAPPLNPAVITIKRIKRDTKNRKKRHVSGFGHIGHFAFENILDMLLRNNLGGPPLTQTDFTDLLDTSVRPTLESVLATFQNITVKNMTLEECFVDTPLQNVWRKLNPDLQIFAIRILHLWQYGGLSLTLDNRNSSINYSSRKDEKLLKFVLEGREEFERLPPEVVTADDEGLHMFTKSSCHVFFGEVLYNLKKAHGQESIKKLLQKSLKVFCRKATVGNNYCKHLIV